MHLKTKKTTLIERELNFCLTLCLVHIYSYDSLHLILN
jgi:hypothetical protein